MSPIKHQKSAVTALPCPGMSDRMVVRRDADGHRRYFRAEAATEEYTYRRPFILEMEITRQCNLHCVHCYAEASDRPGKHELSFAEIDSVLASARHIGIPELSLTGGEVMMRSDFLKIVDRGLALGFNVRFVTNATLLDEAMQSQLARRPIKLITVSLDAFSPGVHEAIRGNQSHAPAMTAILRLKQAGFRVSIITAFSSLNLADFDPLLAFCNTHRIDWQVQITSAKGRCGKEITLTPDEYYTLGEKVARAFVDPARRMTLIPMDDLATFSHFPPLNQLAATWQGMCTGGLLNLFVRANGDVTPCSALCFPSCIVGNVRRDTLAAICEEERCKAILAPFSKKRRKGACRVCPFLDDCGGGCPEILLSMSDSPDENDYCYHRIEQARIVKAVL